MSFPSTYYRHAGMPARYVSSWRGWPQTSLRAAETRGLGHDDYIDVSALVHLHKGLGAYSTSLTAETGRTSIRHSGPEQTKIYDSMGSVLDLSKNEKSAIVLTAIGIAGFLAYKHSKKR